MEAKEVKFVRLSEAAKRLSLPRTRIYELAAAGRVPVVKLADRTMRVPESWLLQLEQEALARVAQAQGGGSK